MIELIATAGVGLEYLGVSIKLLEFWEKAHPLIKDTFNNPYRNAIFKSLDELEKTPENERFCKMIRDNYEIFFTEDQRYTIEETHFCKNIKNTMNNFRTQIIHYDSFSCDNCKLLYNNFNQIFVNEVDKIIVKDTKNKESIKERLSDDENKKFDELISQFNVINTRLYEMQKEQRKWREADKIEHEELLKILSEIYNEIIGSRKNNDFDNINGQIKINELNKKGIEVFNKLNTQKVQTKKYELEQIFSELGLDYNEIINNAEIRPLETFMKVYWGVEKSLYKIYSMSHNSMSNKQERLTVGRYLQILRADEVIPSQLDNLISQLIVIRNIYIHGGAKINDDGLKLPIMTGLDVIEILYRFY